MFRGFFSDRSVRRGFVLLLFVGLVVFFRHLFALFVFFVVFQRVLALMADAISRRTRLHFKASVLVSVVLLVGLIAAGLYAGIETLRHNFSHVIQGVDAIIGTVKSSPLYHRAHRAGLHVTTDELLTHARHHAAQGMRWAGEIGRGALYVVIALIFAVVYLLELDELEAWRTRMPLEGTGRTLLRFVGHVADAVAITLKLQVVVALVNAVVTLPILLVLRLPGIPALVVLLLVTGLIPVVGGPVAGGVLMILAFVARGPVGLAIFVVSTFVLHKIESYYLNPRLTSKHVKLPGFVIIASLVLFEHAFGLMGLFLSFPCLYVAAKIREGWADPTVDVREERSTLAASHSLHPHPIVPPQDG